MAIHFPNASSIALEQLESSESAAFRQFFEIYQAAFPLDDEREGVDAFDAILAMNADAAVQRRYGPYREVVAAIRGWPGGPVIGGHVFGVTSGPAHAAAQVAASVQGIYSFVHPDYRGAVPMQTLIDYARAIAQATFAGHRAAGAAPVPIFIEVNNPLRMTQQQADIDRRLSGVDPARRYVFWMRHGFLPLQVAYVQPGLRSDAERIAYLDLLCNPGNTNSIPTPLLVAHLRSFLSISVFKDADAGADADFVALEEAVRASPTVAFVERGHPSLREISMRAQVAQAEDRHGR